MWVIFMVTLTPQSCSVLPGAGSMNELALILTIQAQYDGLCCETLPDWVAAPAALPHPARATQDGDGTMSADRFSV